MHSRRPTAIDLFAGPGGMTEGLKLAGFHVVAAVEHDPLAAFTYQRNHPEVAVWRTDIREVDGRQVLSQHGMAGIDLIAGCPPCQGFSSVRTRNRAASVHDDRNDLIVDYVRLVTEIRPRAIMLENVPRLRFDDRWRQAISTLDALGYGASSGVRVMDAADHGVPQRRRRLVMVTSLRGPVSPPSRQVRRLTVREAISHLPPAGESGDLLHDLPERRTDRIMQMIKSIAADGGSRRELAPEHRLECHRDFDGFKDVYGRMRWDDVAPTITGGCHNPSKGRFLHPQLNRAITLREAAILQGFRSNYFFALHRGKLAAAAMIGNAMPPPFVRAHALPLRELLVS